jgi:hypothetical protein
MQVFENVRCWEAPLEYLYNGVIWMGSTAYRCYIRSVGLVVWSRCKDVVWSHGAVLKSVQTGLVARTAGHTHAQKWSVHWVD